MLILFLRQGRFSSNGKNTQVTKGTPHRLTVIPYYPYTQQCEPHGNIQ